MNGAIGPLERIAQIQATFSSRRRAAASEALGQGRFQDTLAAQEARSAGAATWSLARTGSAPTSGLDWAAGAPSGALPAGTPYASTFATAGLASGVPARLLAAVAAVESNFRADAVSSAGAQGMMQFMPATAAGMGLQDPFDPESSIDAAARLLAGHAEAFGSWDLALAAYNAGGGAVRRYGGIPPFAQTQAYVAKVLDLFDGGAS